MTDKFPIMEVEKVDGAIIPLSNGDLLHAFTFTAWNGGSVNLGLSSDLLAKVIELGQQMIAAGLDHQLGQ